MMNRMCAKETVMGKPTVARAMVKVTGKANAVGRAKVRAKEKEKPE